MQKNFRVFPNDDDELDESENENLLRMKRRENTRFLRIQAKRIFYMGLPVVAIFMNDKTRKVRALFD